MSIAAFFKRSRKNPRGSPAPIARPTLAQVEAMSDSELEQIVLREIPKFSLLFAGMGDPRAWPAYEISNAEEKSNLLALYTRWQSGGFNDIPGVVAPPPPPGTILQ